MMFSSADEDFSTWMGSTVKEGSRRLYFKSFNIIII